MNAHGPYANATQRWNAQLELGARRVQAVQAWDVSGRITRATGI